MRKIKKGDKVIVISGKNKGKISVVQKVGEKKTTAGIINAYVWLKGVNIAKKAVKKEWFKEIEMPIHISNVQYYSEQDKKQTKVKIVEKDGKKQRHLVAVDRMVN